MIDLMKPARAPVLEARGIVKTYPGVRALDGIDFSIEPGEVHAIVGENGAGKSTLMGILGGVSRPDEGKLFVDGRRVELYDAVDAATAGIGVVFQELSLVQNLSVAENIFADRQPVALGGFVDWKRLRSEAAAMLALFGEDGLDPSTPLRRLPLATQQVIEILKAVSLKPRVLILDEPTSSLSKTEVERLFATISRLKAEGTAIVYISHNLGEVFALADRITVFRDGRRVGTKQAAETTEQEIVSMMVGRDLDDVYGNRTSGSAAGDVVFEASGLTRGKKFRNVSFNVRAGEIVGLFGLVGAGRTELARAIFGADRLDSGSMRLLGQRYAPRSEAEAIRSGTAYLTEDRKALGLVLSMDITANIALPRLGRFARGLLGFLDASLMRKAATEAKSAYNIAAPSVEKKTGQLSGGNQQKVLLSMWLGTAPRFLIVDEPTRGVDVGAKSEIYHTLRRIAEERGVAILVITSDLPEVIGISDRVLVLREGSLAGEFSSAGATEEKVIFSATGVA